MNCLMDSKTQDQKSIGVAVAATSAIYIYLLVFAFPFTPIFSETDQLIFVYEASRLLHGDVMYRDFFQFTFPGTQTYYHVVLSLFGERYWILPFTVVILGSVLTFLCLKLSESVISGSLRFVPSFIFLFFGLRWFGLDGSHRMFSPILMLMAVFFLLSKVNRKRLIAAGVCCALASFFTQQRGVVTLTAIAVYLVLDAFMTPRGKAQALYDIAVMSGTFLMTIGLLCLYFILSAGPTDFFYATFTYPAKYYKYVEANSYSVFVSDLIKTASAPGISGTLMFLGSVFYSVILPFAVLTAFAVFAIRRKNVSWDDWRGPMLLSLLAAFSFFTTTGPNALRFFQVGIPAIIVFCWLLSRIGMAAKKEQRLTLLSLTLLALIGLSQIYRMQTHWDFSIVETRSGKLAFISAEQARFYQDLSDRTQGGEFVYQAVQPYVYFPLGVRNPTRFSQIWQTDYTRPEQVAEAVADLEKKRPRYIVWDNNYNLSPETRKPDDHTGPMAEMVTQKYFPNGPVYEMDGRRIQLWKLRSP
ncbi:MAG: hypothetical protein KF855_02645 [Acidobacteria bacterium]|nr:hypothetical protein [Acidobacteriota bacterium]